MALQFDIRSFTEINQRIHQILSSAIFQIDTPEKAEAFVAALEASEKEPWVRASGSKRYTVETNPDVIRNLHEMRRKKREQLG